MRRIIVLVALAAAVGIGGFLYLFKREAVAELWDSSRGYGKAKTPQECVDRFNQAIKDRQYDKAAKYVTKDYAELLTKGAEPGHELGTTIDDLMHRLKNDGLLTSEIEFIVFLNDPLPKDLQVKLESTGSTEAGASIALNNPIVKSSTTKTWKFDQGFIKALYFDYPTSGSVRLVKEGDAWKIEIPVAPAMRARVDQLTRNYKDYVNAFKVVSAEVKRDPTTKENAANRLEEELNSAVNAAK